MKKGAWIYCLAAIGLVVLVFGCASVQHTVPLVTRTPTVFGNVKVYGTGSVPFEYEELASLAQGYSMWHFTLEESLARFAAKAQEVGADAILNFKMEVSPAAGGFFFVFSVIGPTSSFVTLSGTAVKIKRP